MREQLGVMMSATYNLISDSANDGEGQQGSIKADFGVNRIPTLDEVQASLDNAIKVFNDTLGVDDTRLINMRDFGFAEPRSMQWPPIESEAAEIERLQEVVDEIIKLDTGPKIRLRRNGPTDIRIEALKGED